MIGNGTGAWLAIGWTMLHFLWVGGLIGIVAAIASRALRGTSAEVRYGVALASLAMLALAPAAIAWRMGVVSGAHRTSPEPIDPEAPVMRPPFVRQFAEAPTPIVRTESAGASTLAAVVGAAAAPRPANFASRLDALASRLPWLWLAGSPITFAWLALGLAGAERLRRRSVTASDGELPGLCRRLAGELGIARNVAVALCDRLAAPVLVGIVRPLILLPAAAFGGWAPDQLEMVLLHELVHVRRWDNLVNLLQRLVESALFFHPAVWIVSGWARREREHCCDGVVVAHTGRARAYAETLLSLADPGSDRTPRAAVALAGNHLVARVRRILDLHPEGHAMKLPRGLLTLTAAILIVPAGWTISRARLAAPPSDAQPKLEAEATDPEIDLRTLVARANELAEAAAKSRSDPKEKVHALLDLGASKAQGGDRAGAVAVLHQAAESIKRMEQGRDRMIATKMLAERLALADAADEAIALASSLEENAEGMDMVRSGALNTIAFYLVAAGNDARAIEAARGVRHERLLPSALEMIAEVQARAGDATAAMRTVESIAMPEARIRALVGTLSERDHPGLAVKRGRVRDQLGAQQCLDRARALTASLPDGPKKEEARASIALAVAQLGDVVEGLRQIRALAESETRDTALGQIALLQSQSGAWDDAYRTARSVPDPKRRFFAIFQLGEAQNGVGKRDDARRTFRKLLEANAGPKPLTTDVHSIARAQIYAGDLAAALATIEKMEVPDTQLIEQVAVVQAESGDFSAARTTVAERIPDDAGKAGAYGAIAYYQARAGQAREALRWAESLDHRLHRSSAIMGVATALAERRGVPLDQLQAPPAKAAAGEKGNADAKPPSAPATAPLADAADERAARRARLLAIREKLAAVLRNQRATLRKLAETVGSDDRETLALRQQLAMENLDVLQTELRSVQSQRRKLEAQARPQEAAPKPDAGADGPGAQDTPRELAILGDLEQRLADEIKSLSAPVGSRNVQALEIEHLQEEIAQIQAALNQIDAEVKSLAVEPDLAMIQGKTIEAWKAALKDRDPAVRKRAVEVLGQRAVDPATPAAEKSRLQIDVRSLMLSDKDRDVRQAAAFYADLFKVVDSPEMVERMLEEHRRTVDPARRAIRLVDAQGQPVAGAVASTYFQRDADHEPAFTAPEPIEAATSNARGLLALKLEIPGHLDGAGIYAIRQDKGRPLVGLGKVTRAEIDKPITIVMHPACRVSLRIDSKGLPALEAKYHAELAGPGWWRAAYIMLGEDYRAPRPLFSSTTTGALAFLLPPGRVTISAYGSDVKSVERPIEIKPDDRELSLGTIDVAPSPDAEKGRFPNHHRVRRNGPAGGPEVVFRRIRSLPIRAMAREAHDLAFSPDGKLLASAHSYNADPGEVKLWDMNTGANVATLPVADRAMVSVAFSPDGTVLAGRVHAMADPRSSWEIVLWDVASRREARRLGSRVGRINAMAFSPDGKVLLTSGEDRSVRFWDVASGREDRRIDRAGSGRALAFSPDGQTLVTTGGGGVIALWDVAGNRLRAALEPQDERFAVYAIAYAPDGRTLAAAGSTFGANHIVEQGQARLYDLSREPPARRSVLTFDRGQDVGPNQQTMACSDVAFTPDGRRVAALGMQKVRIWDAATGTELDAFERGASSSSDRLAISPDGRWMAVTSPFGYGIAIFDIIPPGP